MMKRFTTRLMLGLCTILLCAPLYALSADDSHDADTQTIAQDTASHHSSHHSSHHTTHPSKEATNKTSPKTSGNDDSNGAGVCLSCIGQEQ